MTFHSFKRWNVGDDAYHDDPALSPTSLRKKLDPSPPADSDLALRMGSAFHWLLFDQPAAKKLVAERSFGRKKAEQEAKAQWKVHVTREGLIALPADSLDAVHRMVESARRLRDVRRLLEHPDAQIEQAYRLRWGAHADCKRKVDIEIPGVVLVDAKSTGEPSLDAYMRSFVKYGYDLQAAYNHDTGTALHGADYSSGVFHIVCSKKPDCNGDHLTAVLEISPEFIARGRMLYRAALLMAEAERIGGRRPPYPFNAGPRRMRPPKPWEMDEAKALVAHAKKVHRSCMDNSQ